MVTADLQVGHRLRHLQLQLTMMSGSEDLRLGRRCPPAGRARPLHTLATDPLVPLLVFGVISSVGLALSAPLLVWLGLGGVAGYSLSGSV